MEKRQRISFTQENRMAFRNDRHSSAKKEKNKTTYTDMNVICIRNTYNQSSLLNLFIKRINNTPRVACKKSQAINVDQHSLIMLLFILHDRSINNTLENTQLGSPKH